ncbi:argininosuccinate synthase [Actinocrispum wychmicini]|uniref:argininosuccinate synthase n=1 Tax=Actinocrispum wychmicini TaxID=1213861 RepID=A0A4R2JWY5_9PSEU|nr:argininosuccinate synthase [Actinocrispum wychmicini]
MVALYSGGLDSSYLLKLLREAGVREVVALVVDVGDDLGVDSLASRAGRLGADLAVVDAREQFADEFVAPAIQAGAHYLAGYPISSSLSRPLIALKAMEVATECGATAIVHSAHPSQNTLRRINTSLDILGFPGMFGTPFELTPVSRSREAAELAAVGVDELADRTISVDSNLWCREFESGVLEDPERFEIPERLYEWTRPGQPVAQDSTEIRYEGGVPVQVDGRPLGLVELIAEVNRLAGAHGLGRYVGLEHLSTGAKVLEAREMPAAHVLLAGFAHLLSATVDAETIREKLHLDQLWVREAVEGRWFGRLRVAAQEFISSVSAGVSGTVRMKLTGGQASPVSIRARAPLYLRDRGSWDATNSPRPGATSTAAVEERVPAEWPRDELTGVPGDRGPSRPRGQREDRPPWK